MSLLEQLNIDPETFTWQQLALCQEMDTEWFFDSYERDSVIAEQVDAACSVCPVRRECLILGLENNETGVWGGFYLDGTGKLDKKRNSHKPEGWEEEIREILI